MVAEIRKSLAGAIFMAALTGNACAAVISCPSVSDIKQVPGEYGGFAYTATLPNGQKWTGENPMADEGRCCINQGRGEAVLTFTRNDMAVTL
ncbi:hypothetical protein [Ralstonia solanacearum]|uniref:hypothetical protein n=1 Tax=Ralstonia solanacearum TaxID=305 RepID=UPI003D69C12E